MTGYNSFFLGDPEDESKRTSISCRIEMSLYNILSEQARKQGISLSELIRKKAKGK